jgi:hypothetical protein
VSWTRRGFDTVSDDPRAVATRLLRRSRAGDVLLLHDGSARGGARPPRTVEALDLVLDGLAERGLSPVPLPRPDGAAR